MFSKKHITILIIGLAILLKSLMIMHYTDIGGDKIYQTAAAVQIANGKGYTVEVRNPSNPAESYHKPMMLWPPVYAALLAPLIKSGIAPATSTVVLDILNGAFFLLLIYWAASLLNFPFLLKMMVILFKATEINDTILISTPSDYLSLNTCLLAILCLVQYLRSGNMLLLWIFFITNAAGPWIRYSYIPLVVVLPLTFLLVGYIKHEKKWMKAGTFALLLSIASLIGLLYFNLSRTGMYFYVLKTAPGFFPESLQYLPPIVLMSLININFPLTQLSLRTDLSYTFFMNCLRLVNLLLIIGLLHYATRILRTSKNIIRGTAPVYFFVFSVSLSVSTLLMLALLSITRSRKFRIDEYWSYIEEPRYMMLVTITLMFLLIFEFCVRKSRQNTWTGKLLSMAILFIMLMETAHGLWIIARRPIHPSDDAAIFYGNQITANFIQGKLEQGRREGWELILMDEDYNLRGYGLLKGIGIIDDPTQFKKLPTANNNRMRILFSLKPGHEPLYPFFLNPGIKYCGVYEHYRFYELNLP